MHAYDWFIAKPRFQLELKLDDIEQEGTIVLYQSKEEGR